MFICNKKLTIFIHYKVLSYQSLYVIKFIRNKVYTEQSLYGTKVYTGQSLYGTKFIQNKVYTEQSFSLTCFPEFTEEMNLNS